MNISHDSKQTQYRKPFGAVRLGSEVFLSIDVTDPAPSGVMLEVWHSEETYPTYYDMAPSSDVGGRYEVTIKAPDEKCLLWYAFEIKFEEDGVAKTIYYGNNQDYLGGWGQTYDDNPKCYQITVYKEEKLPDWYDGGIVYQIFTDRFARDDAWRERCEPVNARINERREDVRRVLEENWNKEAYYEHNEVGAITAWPVYGGSLKGIESKLDYLKSLGVSCIYLNPIFEATSNHRYDTADYMHIDPALGTDEDFAHLCKVARGKGIRIMLDGVFSHTGSDSIYFDRCKNYRSPVEREDATYGVGAWDNPESPYRDWYKFDENDPSIYISWWGIGDLPEVYEDNPTFTEFITGEDGVLAHWLRLGASAWRLDVADELPDSFIRKVRARLDAFSDDTMLIGEVWEDASNKVSYGETRQYLLGGELGGTMNYPLRDILLDYINYTISSGYAADKLTGLQENYPREHFYAALNLIGSHDRERVLTAMAAEEDYDSAVKKVRVLSTLQYTLPGVPCIYYGDEVGLLGGTDPANRSCYPWGYENLDLGYHYRMLGVIYDQHPVLKNGELTMLSGRFGISDDVFAFIRSDEGSDEKVLVLANRSYEDVDVYLGEIEEAKCGYAIELLRSAEMSPDENGSLGTIHMNRLSAKVICLKDKAPKGQDMGRQSGVICHISSLGTPTLGKPARDFVDFISESGFGIWQVLPLNPPGTGGSPYSSNSAFAGDTRFINHDEMPSDEGFEAFARANSDWLTEYAAYTVTKESQDMKSWHDWPEELRDAKPEELMLSFNEKQQGRAYDLIHEQYVFCTQWQELKDYANSKGVSIMGDLPMFMASDSADVWANKDLFRLKKDETQSVCAGVPPDPFTGEGQYWGNPLYNWDKMRKSGCTWWMRRIRQCAERYDMLRIDHFRGLSEYFAIPEGTEPKEGYWQHGPGLELFRAIDKMLSEEGRSLKILAEDLGYLDDGVKDLLHLSGLPGMYVWQFTADEMLGLSPEEAGKRAFYTGTHDNDTLVGFVTRQKPDQNAEESAEATDEEIKSEAKHIIEQIYESPACLAMMQIQDVFLLGTEARMNVPGVPEGNWTWKMPEGSIYDAYECAGEMSAWLKDLAERSNRK